MSRKGRLFALGGLVLVVVIVLLATYVQGQQLSPQDRAMKATAQRFTSALREPDSRYSAITDPLQAFDLFQADQRLVLQKRMKALAGPGQLVQIVVWETKTMPPQTLVLTGPGEPAVNVSGDALTKAAQGSDTYTTGHANTQGYRVYVTALQPPPSIRQLDAHEVLEIIRLAG